MRGMTPYSPGENIQATAIDMLAASLPTADHVPAELPVDLSSHDSCWRSSSAATARPQHQLPSVTEAAASNRIQVSPSTKKGEPAVYATCGCTRRGLLNDAPDAKLDWQRASSRRVTAVSPGGGERLTGNPEEGWIRHACGVCGHTEVDLPQEAPEHKGCGGRLTPTHQLFDMAWWPI